MWTRRRFVAASLASWLWAGLPRARAEAKRRAASGPRYFVTFFLRGGIDAVYTVDPKTRAEVDPRVDIPYDANSIIDAGGLPLGPHFAPLAKWANKMAILRGVQVKTANHETGATQIVRMRTRVTTSMPSLYDVIGHSRDTQPLASVLMGEVSSFEHSPGSLASPTGGEGGVSSLQALDALSDEDVAMLASAFQKHAARLGGAHATAEGDLVKEHVTQAAAFFDRMQHIPRFRAEQWIPGNGKPARAAEDMQRVLWFLEHDLARGICVKIFFDWDSHFRNAEKQQQANAAFTNILDRFLTGLHGKRNAYGSLADQTVVVVASELGRFPIINGNLGKDHFPEAPLLFFGPGLNTGGGRGAAYVPTGKMMEGRKVSLATGQPDDNGTHLVLDDVGTTLMHMAGMNPAVYGYTGRRLSFLEASA